MTDNLHTTEWDSKRKLWVCACGWTTDNAAMALMHSALKEHLAKDKEKWQK